MASSEIVFDKEGDVVLVLDGRSDIVPQLDDLFKHPLPSVDLHYRSPQSNYGSSTRQYGSWLGFKEDCKPQEEAAVDWPEQAPHSPTHSRTRIDSTPSVAETQETAERYGTVTRFRVSSKHLKLGSPYFKRNLDSSMAESTLLKNSGCIDLPMSEFDSEAMRIIMAIFHGRSSQVPRFVDMETLTKLSVIVDYLECLEVMEPYSYRWFYQFGDYGELLPTTFSKEHIQWFCISTVFHQEHLFKLVTGAIMKMARDEVQSLDLPIPGKIIDSINNERNQSLDQLFSAFDQLLDNFRRDCTDCSFQCNAMLFGILTKELSGRGLLPRPQIPFSGYSIADLLTSLTGIQDPIWSLGHGHYGGTHSCDLTSYTNPIVSGICDNLKEFSLED